MKRIAGIVALLLAVGIGAGLPATAVKEMVAARQASMKSMAEAAKAISGMFSGKLSYDSTAFKQAAETIRRYSGSEMVEAFPPDTLGQSSAAKLEIDQAREEFTTIANRLESLAAAMSAAADNAPDGITEAMRMTAGTTMGSSLLSKRNPVPAAIDLSRVPAEHLFHMMLQVCTDCHARFREKPQ